MHTKMGSFSVHVYHGQARSSHEFQTDDIILTTYSVVESDFRRQQYGFKRGGVLMKEESPLHSVYWGRIILDEAHAIKDRSSNTARAVFNLGGERKWSLSGTPLQNRVGELYSLIRFMQISKLFYRSYYL